MPLPPPLASVRVLELAGLAPGPFAGLLLADYGASILRLDRPSAKPGVPTDDQLVRRKKSIAVDLKDPNGLALLKAILPHVDVVIDPFRPGVLEKLGIAPQEVMLKINPRLIIARLTGYRRDGKYKDMAGHDINYVAASGMLSMFGRAGEKPHPPGNVLGDFAGGGAVAFTGILLALLARNASGKGQVVEANMVDGASFMGTFQRLATKRHLWAGGRGRNVLDGGAPYYDTYETKDGKYMAVGALELHFYDILLKCLEIPHSALPGPRNDPTTWSALRALFTKTFKTRTRAEWEAIFDGTDACCTPVVTQAELEADGYQQRPLVTLRESPGLAIERRKRAEDQSGTFDPVRGQGEGVIGDGWDAKGLVPGNGGAELLANWLGWTVGKQLEEVNGGLVWKGPSKL